MTPLPTQAVQLVKQGAVPGAKDKHGRTPLHYAASHGHHEVCDLMYMTCCMCQVLYVICARLPQVGEFLSTRGVELDAEDPQGRSALHFACTGEGGGMNLQVRGGGLTVGYWGLKGRHRTRGHEGWSYGPEGASGGWQSS